MQSKRAKLRHCAICCVACRDFGTEPNAKIAAFDLVSNMLPASQQQMESKAEVSITISNVLCREVYAAGGQTPAKSDSVGTS
jgi:hypothetical protein